MPVIMTAGKVNSFQFREGRLEVVFQPARRIEFCDMCVCIHKFLSKYGQEKLDRFAEFGAELLRNNELWDADGKWLNKNFHKEF